MNEQQSQHSWVRRHPIWTVLIAIVGILVAVLLYAWFMPFSVDTPGSEPAQSYEDAIARIEAIQATEDALGDVLP